MPYDFNEEQRLRALRRKMDLEKEARSLSTGELYQALGWQEELTDHYAEIGEPSHNGTAAAKADVIRAELRRRGRY